MDVMKNTPAEMFANAIISGWIIATMVWMFPSAGSAIVVIICDDLADCAGGHHAYCGRYR
jgi:formate/nitrite transporter FocA (FNT family)